MIVINKNKLSVFNSVKSNFTQLMSANFCDIIPIEIKNNLYILPEDVLTHDVFKNIFETFNDYEIREVEQNEFIVYNLF